MALFVPGSRAVGAAAKKTPGILLNEAYPAMNPGNLIESGGYRLEGNRVISKIALLSWLVLHACLLRIYQQVSVNMLPYLLSLAIVIYRRQNDGNLWSRSLLA